MKRKVVSRYAGRHGGESARERKALASANATAPVHKRSRLVRCLRVLGWVCVWLLMSLGAVLAGTAIWIRRIFGTVTVEQLLLHLPAGGGEQLTEAEAVLVGSFVKRALVLPLICVILVGGVCLAARIWYRWWVRRRRVEHQRQVPERRLAPRQAKLSEGAKVKGALWRRLLVSVLPVCAAFGVCGAGAAVLAQTIDAPQYVQSFTSKQSMNDYYVVPVVAEQALAANASNDELRPRKNLVMIYLESVDDAFTDADRFGANLVEPLVSATADWASIPELLSYEGGGWTMAGMVSTQCGVPLRGGQGISDDLVRANAIDSSVQAYLPGAVCLGDVLKASGYTNAYLAGASLGFASKGTFLRTHGYEHLKGLHELQEEGVVPDSELWTWGVSDRMVMEQAKLEVARLHESAQPFNLTLLTLDFHEPSYLFEHCPARFDDVMSSALLCSMGEVADFIYFLEDSGYLEDTVVVLMADHPTMTGEGRPYWSQFADIPMNERPLFNRIWSPDGVELVRQQVDQLSMYPTLLDLLDLGLADGRAGLGVSALNSEAQNAEILALPSEEYNDLLRSRSKTLYQRLWQNAYGSEDG